MCILSLISFFFFMDVHGHLCECGLMNILNAFYLVFAGIKLFCTLKRICNLKLLKLTIYTVCFSFDGKEPFSQYADFARTLV